MNLKKYLTENLASSSIDISSDEEIFRWIIIAEADAINFYEQLATKAKNKQTKKLLFDIAKEEKIHMYEALQHLELIDNESKEVINKAKKETKELLKDNEF